MSRWLERFRPYLMVAPAIIVFVLFFYLSDWLYDLFKFS